MCIGHVTWKLVSLTFWWRWTMVRFCRKTMAQYSAMLCFCRLHSRVGRAHFGHQKNRKKIMVPNVAWLRELGIGGSSLRMVNQRQRHRWKEVGRHTHFPVCPRSSLRRCLSCCFAIFNAQVPLAPLAPFHSGFSCHRIDSFVLTFHAQVHFCLIPCLVQNKSAPVLRRFWSDKKQK